MSAYGFDLDDTLTVSGIRQMANDLFQAGHSVYVITGAFADTGEWTLEGRIQQLTDLGVSYTEIIRCIAPTWEEIGRMKGEACDRLHISVFIDDFDVYLNNALTQAAKLLVV